MRGNRSSSSSCRISFASSRSVFFLPTAAARMRAASPIQLVSALGQQTPEPLARRSRLEAHPHPLALPLQLAVKRYRFRRMRQPLFLHGPYLIVKDRENFEPHMEITTYNQPRWLLSGPPVLFAQEHQQATPARSQGRYEIKRRRRCAAGVEGPAFSPHPASATFCACFSTERSRRVVKNPARASLEIDWRLRQPVDDRRHIARAKAIVDIDH